MTTTAPVQSANAPDPVLEELADLLEAFDEVGRLRPLALVRAWHQEGEGRTSQRAILALLEQVRTVLVFGGNRSGKTYLLLCVVMALALGSDHPDARDFWTANGCDPDSFPRGPGRCWIIALTAPDSLEYHRQPMLALVPGIGPAHFRAEKGETHFAWNMRGRGQAELEIRVPGYDHPAVIVFKADHPGPDSMQGSECRAILHDEESTRWESHTWDQCEKRLIDTDGWQLMSNTPIRGRTWVFDRFVEGAEDGAAHRFIHSTDNPWTSKRRIRKIVARAEDGDRLALAALFGVFVTLRGLVWPEWRRDVHLCDPFEIPADWLRWTGDDFGLNNPTARLWGALSPDDVLYLYREYYVAGPGISYEMHADAIHEIQGDVINAEGRLERGRWLSEEEGGGFVLESDPAYDRPGRGVFLRGEAIQASFGDPSANQDGIPVYCSRDLPTDMANRGQRVGLNEVRDRLSRAGGGAPRIQVFRDLIHFRKEIEGYIWNPKMKAPTPLKKDDHLMDAFRYLCMGIRESKGV